MEIFKPYIISGLTLALFGFPSLVFLQSRDFYFVGNSLTFSTHPDSIEGEVRHHIQTNNNLYNIFTNPFVNGPGSIIWTDELHETHYDALIVQIYFGTTLAQDLEVISHFADLQPDTDIIIFTGWPQHPIFEERYSNPAIDNTTGQTFAYVEAVRDAVQLAYPDRFVKITGHYEVLETIRINAENNVGPFNDFSDMFRDVTHLSYTAGEYFAHNMMRQALGQPLQNSVVAVNPVEKAYLDGLIADYDAAAENDIFMPLIATE